MNTLTYNGTTVTLPPALYWADETTWSRVVHTPQRSVEGNLYLHVHARTGGRPITLMPLAETDDWIHRSLLEILLEWANTPRCEMLLSYRGKEYNVVWRHQDDEVISSVPVVHYDDSQPNDWFQTTLKFLEI